MLYRHVCLSNGEIYGMSNPSFRRFCQSCNIPDQILTAKELGIHVLLNPSQLTVKIQYSYQVHSLSARIKTTVMISNCRLFVLISYAGSKSKPDNRQLVFTSFLCSVMKMAMRKYYSKDSQPSHRYQCCLVLACWWLSRMMQLLKNNILPQASPVHTEDYTLLYDLSRDCSNPQVIVTATFIYSPHSNHLPGNHG